jgi:hypothetical protein
VESENAGEPTSDVCVVQNQIEKHISKFKDFDLTTYPKNHIKHNGTKRGKPVGFVLMILKAEKT